MQTSHTPFNRTTQPRGNAPQPATSALKPRGSSVTAIRKTRGEDATELQYAELCSRDSHNAVLNGVVHVWKQDHWQVQTDEEAAGDALQWLSIFDRGHATARTAQSCLDTAKFLMRQLPPAPSETIVPVEGRWLVLNEDGNYEAVEPDPAVGVCYRIQCGKVIPNGPYEPEPLPADSLFAKFLETSLPVPEVRDLVQDYIGYSLGRSSDLQVAQFWSGAGANGKSTLVNIVSALHEKTVAMRLDKLDGFDLDALVGASLAVCDETPKANINQQALKSLVTGGKMQVNPKHKKHFTYVPQAKWIICSNHLPAIVDQSHGYWRRLHLIEWSQQIPRQKAIRDLDRRIIRDELHLVLDWALIGLRRLRQRGDFIVPAVVEMAKADAIQISNTVSQWVEDCGVAMADGEAMTDKSVLYARYFAYCDKNGLTPVGNAQFFIRLRNLFPVLREDKTTRTVGMVKERVRRLSLVLGKFPEEPAKDNPVAATADTTMDADCPFPQ